MTSTTQRPISTAQKPAKTLAPISQLLEQWQQPQAPKLDLMTDLGMKLVWTRRFLKRDDSLLKTLEQSLHRKMLKRSEAEVNEVIDIPHISIEDIDPASLQTIFDFDFPVVIKGFFKNSPAVKTWSLDFLKQHYGDRQVPFVEQTFTEEDEKLFYKTHLSAEASLNSVIDGIRAGERKYIMGCASLFGENQELLEQLNFEHAEEYFGREIQRPEFFVGGPQNLSYYHCAPLANLFCQVHGEKEWTFVAPSHTAWIYPNIGHSRLGCYFASPIISSQQQRDPSRYPLFQFVPKMKARVAPGDLLYNPPWWWHEVSNVTESIGIAQRVLSSGGKHSNGVLFNLLVASSSFIRNRMVIRIKQGILHPGERFMDLDDTTIKESIHN